MYQYAAYHIDENGYSLNRALLEFGGKEGHPKKSGDIVTGWDGKRYRIDFCIYDPEKDKNKQNEAGL